MIIYRNVSITILCSFLLAQCSSKQNENIDKAETNSLFGQWYYDFPFYSSELFINGNGTFKFHEQGCLGNGYTEGKWIKTGANVFLTSFEKYNSNSQKKVDTTATKISLVTSKNRKQRGKIEYILDTSALSRNLNNKVSFNDTSNVYFKNVQLRFEGDTLYRLDENGMRTNIKFALIKRKMKLF